MPDGTIVKNVPDGVTKAQLAARLSKAGAAATPAAPAGPAEDTYFPVGDSRRYPAAVTVSPPKPKDGVIDTAARAVLQGAMGNFADEALAGVDAVAQPLLHGGSDAKTIGERYDENLVSQRERFKADAEAHPVADIVGNVAGTLAGPGKLLKGAKGAIGLITQGAALGGIYGFGQGEGGIENRLESGAEGAAIGGATGGVMAGGTKIYNKIRPSNMAADFVNKQFSNSKMAGDSAQLAQDIGQTYTPGQATGSKALLTIEGLVRRHPVSADTMQRFDEKQLDVSLNNLITNLDRLHANPAGPEATGNLVSKAFDKVVNTAATVRRATAKADFGRVDELAGRYRVVKPNNLNSTLDDIAKDFSAPGGGDAVAGYLKQVQRIKADLDRAGPAGLSAKETQRLLQIYGDAARGTGKVFADMENAQQRMIAGKIQRALMDDVDAAADSGGHVGEIAKALKTARDNYKSNSQAINSLEESVMGRLFGGDYAKAPERVAQAMKNMKPSELIQSMGILNKADPTTAQVVKRYLVEDALSAAGHNPHSGAPVAQISGQDAFSPAKFLTAIRKSNVWKTFSPTERQGMEQAVRDLERVSYRAGTDGSPTAPLTMAMNLFSNRAGRTLAGGATGAAIAGVSGGDMKEGAMAGAVGGGATGLAIPRLAKLITTPQGQQALRTLRVAKPNSKAALAATSTIIGMFAPTGDQGGKEATP